MQILHNTAPKRLLWALGAAVIISTFMVLQRGKSRLVPAATRQPTKDVVPAVVPAVVADPSILDDISNSTLGFEKILVVSLPSRTDRRDGITLQAALSNMDIQFVDGVIGSDIPVKAIPKAENMGYLTGAVLGSWRGHMNAIQEVVRRNLSSALILEDDADWDIRLRQQLRDFALSAHALTQPLQSMPGSYADPTYPNPSDDSPRTVPDIPFNKLPATIAPQSSPYGEGWDILWIGHCGMQFPSGEDMAMPIGRVVQHDDITVPEKQHLWGLNTPFTLKENYPDHTRAVHHVQEGVCTLGYAVSQQGARKMLLDVGLKGATDAFDILLRFFCEGTQGRSNHNCLTTQPGLFQHHRVVGPAREKSDIGHHSDTFQAKADTDMIRWSVRLNAKELLNGGTNFRDQFPDTT